ncbi:MAG: hypothetical protein U0T73_07050 [Chitinophagales bacterium]
MKHLKNRLQSPALIHLSNEELQALVEKYPFYARAYAEMARRAGTDQNLLEKAAIYAASREQLREQLLNNFTPENSEILEPNEVNAVAPIAEISAAETEVSLVKDSELAANLTEENLLEESNAVDAGKEAEKSSENPEPHQEVVADPNLIEEETENKVTAIPPPEPEVIPSAEEPEPASTENVDEGVSPEFLHTPHTFDEWLSAFGKTSRPAPEPQALKKADEELNRLIETSIPSEFFTESMKTERNYTKGLDRFIEAQKSKALQHKQPGSGSVMVTETLAKIYEKQGLTEKAIAAYEQLSLKFPEKKAFFALRIQNLKEK